MIATLSGKLLLKYLDRAVVDVAGVGYEVFMTSDGISRLGDLHHEVFLFIYTNVRDDAIVLFGFLEEEEKEMFLILRTVSGVGPKLALSILSGLAVTDLSKAIVMGDIKQLTSLQGVGKKTAERLCVDLKEKVSHLAGSDQQGGYSTVSVTSAAGSVVADAISALTNLGYPDPIARSGLATVKKQMGDEVFASMSLEELLKKGLRALA